MMDDFSAFVPQVHFELVPIRDLVSNQDYQRNLSMVHVAKAVEEFDLNQINPIKVSRRNGVNYVFNGQHTAEIVAMASGSRDTPVWCMIYEDLEYIEEADIFANQMKNVKPLMPIEIFKANCEAGNDKELMIKGLVESYNLRISASAAPCCITAVKTLELIYDKYGYEMLDRVIRLIVATWEGEPRSFSSSVMNGIARLLYAYKEAIDEKVFKEKLSTISIRELMKAAKDRRAGSLGYAEAMLIIYNKNKRNGLQWNVLYNSKLEAARRMNEQPVE